MVNGKFDGLMEKFLKEDQNIAASNCQICQQIFKSSALMKIKYIEKFCSDAICEKLIQIDQPEILICKPYWTDIKKKSLPRMETTNERCVTAFKGILKTLTKLEWTLLKPIRISQTVFNIYLNENNYEMIDAINSVEDGKPIFVTFLPSMTTIKIYIFGKIDNLKPIICRSKLLKTFEILKEINPFYSEIQYNPNFEFADDSVSFQRKGQNPDYRILIEEYEGNENVANVDFMELIKIQDGKFGRVVETRTKPISDTLWIKNRPEFEPMISMPEEIFNRIQFFFEFEPYLIFIVGALGVGTVDIRNFDFSSFCTVLCAFYASIDSLASFLFITILSKSYIHTTKQLKAGKRTARFEASFRYFTQFSIAVYVYTNHKIIQFYSPPGKDALIIAILSIIGALLVTHIKIVWSVLTNLLNHLKVVLRFFFIPIVLRVLTF
uniref:Uncharacterized protein n=1 Tax=Panagrolaimus davidi TaxID=227884 RepID=A0A914PTC5_9BILA